jgi:translation initiation factor 2-alpha kinase 4
MSTTGTSIQPDVYPVQNVIPNKDVGSSDVQLVLPGDTKKQRKHVKQLFLDRGKYFCLR